jgi:hypothetical protein
MADTSISTTGTDRDPDAIERDIRETQNDISDTVEQLQRRLNPRTILDSLIGDEQQSSQRLLSAARDNPVAVALIGAGALWLASGRGMPSMGGSGQSSSASGGQSIGEQGGSPRSAGSWLGRRSGHHDPHHQSYLDYMAQHGQRDDESDEAYQRRRDHARSTYFMIERDHGEDDASFRRRLNEAGEQLRARTSFGQSRGSSGYPADSDSSWGGGSGGSSGEGALSRARQAFSAKVGSAREQVRSGSSTTMRRAGDFYDSNPAIGGLIAAALGAIVGAALPPSEVERRQLGSIGQQARERLSQGKDRAMEQAQRMLEPSNGGQSGEEDTSEAAGGGISTPS